MSFAVKFRTLREAKGMPQASCDEIFGLMRGTVSNWENGYDLPEDELIYDLARYYDVKYRDLADCRPA